ncbi:hypothetical protein HHK36_029911 [Tetracentron sinense]|uniref:Protein BIG GRAIN 1-like E n=1 Tax=Tetracentron sinense TaxID=13715 RepID=A0A835D266_TETSI|nr:hypothetical protein HHK36_029911 [Tetracentron sinense]
MKKLQTTSSTMFITGFSDPDKLYKKSAHRRKDFGEIDVFKAERYFSSGKEVSGFDGAVLPQKIMREDQRKMSRGGSINLDIPMRNTLPPHSQLMEKQMKKKEYKQPISPGGKLASFLNSLFHKAASKRKKSKSTTQSVKDEEESPGGRRRRSSISNFRSASTGDSKSMYSSSSSGFRTPPPYVNTPTNFYKDLRSYSDHKQGVSLSKYSGQVRSIALQTEDLGEKHKVSNGVSEKNKNFRDGFSEKDGIWVEKYPSEDKNFRRFNEVDDGGDSDSSSDLFELQNYDLGRYYSSGLPVYETTHMDSIKRGPPISNGPL